MPPPEPRGASVRRREFLGTLGGAVAWPLVARAQQPARMTRVGVSLSGSANDGNTQRMLAAFKKGMQTLGWIEGQNVRYEVYWGDGIPERIASNAKELVNAAPDALLTVGTPTTAALRRETGSIPIVFTVVSDPVGDGFVESLSHPGGNVTGFITFYPEIVGKWLGTLKELAPQVKRTALIFNPRTAPFAKSDYLRPQFEQAARRFAVEPIMSPVHDLAGIKMSIDAVARQPGGSLLVMPDSFMLANRMSILELNARLRVPAMYPFSVFATDGGLIAYGVDMVDLNRRAASYMDRIIKGTKPAALPVQAPTKFELVINLRIAKVLALTVPPTLLAIADKVID
jgi:putative ABC transport system substrate-binding protein